MDTKTNSHVRSEASAGELVRIPRRKAVYFIVPLMMLFVAACYCGCFGPPAPDGRCAPGFFGDGDSGGGYDCQMATVTTNPPISQCVQNMAFTGIRDCYRESVVALCISDCGATATALAQSVQPMSLIITATSTLVVTPTLVRTPTPTKYAGQSNPPGHTPTPACADNDASCHPQTCGDGVCQSWEDASWCGDCASSGDGAVCKCKCKVVCPAAGGACFNSCKDCNGNVCTK